MSGITKQQVIDYLSALSPDGLQDLLLELEDLWGMERLAVGVSPVDMGAPIDMGVPRAYELILRDVGDRRVHVMKVLRELYGVGLKEAKSMVERAGDLVIAEYLHGDVAHHMAARLRDVGAKVEIV